MPPIDPRTHAYRPDLADVSLSGAVKAERFAEPTLRQCVRGVVPLLASPQPNARQVSQIRYGEFVDVFELNTNDFAWVQNRTDRYVGYMPAIDMFSDKIAALSNRVQVLRTFVYPEPDLKSPPIDELTLGSFVSFSGRSGAFVQLTSGGYVFAGHIKPADEALTSDYVFTAGRLLNVPYLWGGRTPRGIDCSGLVQLALEMAGIDCPRDSDQQAAAFGRPLTCHWRDMGWRRGDLVFFSGHVGIMTGAEHIIHASGHHMQVVVEPLVEAVLARGNDIESAGRP